MGFPKIFGKGGETNEEVADRIGIGSGENYRKARKYGTTNM
jgi:hypothetical protein